MKSVKETKILKEPKLHENPMWSPYLARDVDASRQHEDVLVATFHQDGGGTRGHGLVFVVNDDDFPLLVAERAQPFRFKLKGARETRSGEIFGCPDVSGSKCVLLAYVEQQVGRVKDGRGG